MIKASGEELKLDQEIVYKKGLNIRVCDYMVYGEIYDLNPSITTENRRRAEDACYPIIKLIEEVLPSDFFEILGSYGAIHSTLRNFKALF